jgi:hypothetical protein
MEQSMRWTCLLVGLGLGGLAAPAHLAGQDVAPAERQAVLAAVDTFFASMSRRDTDLARAIMLPGSMVYSVVPGSEPRSSPDSAFIRSLSSGTSRLRERIWNPRVEIHGPMAEVWTAYDFHVDGKFSHCGIDDFSLVLTPTGWRIASVTYTVERTGCAPSPLGPLPAE